MCVTDMTKAFTAILPPRLLPVLNLCAAAAPLVEGRCLLLTKQIEFSQN